MSDVAIQTHGLGKSYNLGLSRRGYGTLRESMVETAKGSLGRLAGRRRDETPGDTLWALKDLSLTIHPSEVVGLIGHNCKNKSTLLKIL